MAARDVPNVLLLLPPDPPAQYRSSKQLKVGMPYDGTKQLDGMHACKVYGGCACCIAADSKCNVGIGNKASITSPRAKQHITAELIAQRISTMQREAMSHLVAGNAGWKLGAVIAKEVLT